MRTAGRGTRGPGSNVAAIPGDRWPGWKRLEIDLARKQGRRLFAVVARALTPTTGFVPGQCLDSASTVPRPPQIDGVTRHRKFLRDFTPGGAAGEEQDDPAAEHH